MADSHHLLAIPAFVDGLESQRGVHPLRDKTNIIAPPRIKLKVHVAGTQTDAVMYNHHAAKFTKGLEPGRSSRKEDPFGTEYVGYLYVTPVTPYALRSIGTMWSTGDHTLSRTTYAPDQRAAKAVTTDISFTVKDLQRAGWTSQSSSPGFYPYGGHAIMSISDPLRSPTIPLSVGDGSTSSASSSDAPQQVGAQLVSNLYTSLGFFAHRGYNQLNTREDYHASGAATLTTSSGTSSDDELGYSFHIAHLGRNGQVSTLYYEPSGLESPPSAELQRVTKAKTRNTLDDSPQQRGIQQAPTFSPGLFARQGHNQSSARADSRTSSAAPVTMRSGDSGNDKFEDAFQLVHLTRNGHVSPLCHEPDGLDSAPSVEIQRVTKATTRMLLNDSPSLAVSKQTALLETKPPSASHLPRHVARKAVPRISVDKTCVPKVNSQSRANNKPPGLNRIKFEPKFSAAPQRPASLPRVPLRRGNATRIAFGRGTTDVQPKKIAATRIQRVTKDAGLGIQARPTGAKCPSVTSASLVRPAKDNLDKISLVAHVTDARSLNLSEDIKSVVRVKAHILDRIKEPTTSFHSDVTSAFRTSSHASRIPRPSAGGLTKQKVSVESVERDTMKQLADMKRALDEQRGMIGDLYNRLGTGINGLETDQTENKNLLAENKRLVAENAALKKVNAELNICSIKQRGDLHRPQVENASFKNAQVRLSAQVKDALSEQVHESAMKLELLNGQAAL